MFLSTISRFALWEPEAAANLDEQYLPPEVKQALPVSLGLLDGLSTAQLPDAARLCIGNFLESHNFGLECSALGRRASGLVEIESHILKTPVTVLELSVRASNCLDKASVTTIGELILISPENLMDMPSMGKKTRDEIVESLNKIGIPCPPDNLPFSSRLIWNGSGINSFPLATLLSIEESVLSPDTRAALGQSGWMLLADLVSNTWRQIEEASKLTHDQMTELHYGLDLLGLTLPCELPSWLPIHVASLRHTFSTDLRALRGNWSYAPFRSTTVRLPEKAIASSLSEELQRLIPNDSRKRKILELHFGLDGSLPKTLEETGRMQSPPLTRERIRQITNSFKVALKQNCDRLIWLEEALQIATNAAPCRVEEFERELLSRKIVTSPLRLLAVLELAEVAGLDHDLYIANDLLLTKQMQAYSKVTALAEAMVSRWGIADWEEIAPSLTSAQSPSGGSLRIDLFREAVWLGGSDRYFLVPTGKNGLANRLKHVLQVASNLSLKAAYDAIFRDTRVDASRLPFACFRDFCSAWPWCAVREDRVLATEAMPPIELISNDDLLVAILRRFDRPVERFEIRELAHEAGIGEPSLNHLLSYSNVIIRTGPSLYSLVSDVAPFNIDAVIETEPKSGQVETEASQAWESSDSLVADHTTATDPTSLLDGLDPASSEFSLRLTERIGLKNLPIPWSAAEIRLSSADRSALRQWGQVGKWDLRRDSRLTVEFNGRTHRGRLAFGLTFLLFCGEIARAEAASGTIWPPIYEAFGTQQREFLFAQEASPKLWLRDAAEEGCRVFGLRHGFGELGQQAWLRTILMQFGLGNREVATIQPLLGTPIDYLPVALQMLLGVKEQMFAEGFSHLWKTLQQVRRGWTSPALAKQELLENPWTPLNEVERLLEYAQDRSRDIEGITGLQTNVQGKEVEAYAILKDPRLLWSSDGPEFLFELNPSAPTWLEHERFHLAWGESRTVVLRHGSAWELERGENIRVPLRELEHQSVCFDLLVRKESVLSKPLEFNFVPAEGFAIFNLLSGEQIEDPWLVRPDGRPLAVLHPSGASFSSECVPTEFLSIFGGSWRISSFRRGVPIGTALMFQEELLWTPTIQREDGPVPIKASLTEGRWGSTGCVCINGDLPPDFLPAQLSLAGRVASVHAAARGGFEANVQLTPEITRAKTGRLGGATGYRKRSLQLQMNHHAHWGAALQGEQSWLVLSGSKRLSVHEMRGRRLLVKPDPRLSDVPELKDWRICEGDRILQTPQLFGSELTGVHGLGSPLVLLPGPYNRATRSMTIATSLINSGCFRNAVPMGPESWSLQLSHDIPLGQDHSVWIWSASEDAPRLLTREEVEQNDENILVVTPISHDPIVGFALGYKGVRLGSTLVSMGLSYLEAIIRRTNGWESLVRWLRWWHAPVLDRSLLRVLRSRALDAPIETCAGWLTSSAPDCETTTDEQMDDAWAIACREVLWGWKPTSQESVRLLAKLDIWTGDPGHDLIDARADCLLRSNPMLLAHCLEAAATQLYGGTAKERCVLLRFMREGIFPVRGELSSTSFRKVLEQACKQSAGENGLDEYFIRNSLVEDARRYLHDDKFAADLNLRLSLNYVQLRSLFAAALIEDTAQRWENA